MIQNAADEIVKQTCTRIDEENLPLFETDGRKYYKQALLDKYIYITKFPKTERRGRPRKPMKMPLLIPQKHQRIKGSTPKIMIDENFIRLF